MRRPISPIASVSAHLLRFLFFFIVVVVGDKFTSFSKLRLENELSCQVSVTAAQTHRDGLSLATEVCDGQEREQKGGNHVDFEEKTGPDPELQACCEWASQLGGMDTNHHGHKAGDEAVLPVEERKEEGNEANNAENVAFDSINVANESLRGRRREGKNENNSIEIAAHLELEFLVRIHVIFNSPRDDTGIRLDLRKSVRQLRR